MTAAREPTTEDMVAVIAAVALDVDGVMVRASRAAQRLEAMGAEPNLVVAARRAAAGLGELAAKVRRDGLLRQDQQQLL